MRVLISTEEGTQFIYYKSAIQALCRKGHKVSLIFAKTFGQGVASELDRLKRDFPGFDYGHSFYTSGIWHIILRHSRAIANYRHFLILKSRGYLSSFYSQRLRKYFPWWLRPFVALPYLNINFLIKTAAFGKLLDWIEYKAPPDEKIVNQIREIMPDVVIVSPGNLISSTPDYDYIAAAQHLGIPAALFVVSWDNLETKGRIHRLPDFVFVWNEIQKDAAIKNHNVPADRIRTVGAPFFDEWFENIKLLSREEFCKKYNLDNKAPFLLYMSSTPIYTNEIELLRYFIKILRESNDPELKKIQMLVRPHPASNKFFKALKPEEGILQDGDLPDSREELEILYNTLYHSAAVLGVCTSGFIPAFIVERPVITMPVRRYEHIQKYAPHCRQLEECGVLNMPQTPEEFRKTIKNIIKGADDKKEIRADFIKNYVRPYGLDISGGEVFARELEALFANHA